MSEARRITLALRGNWHGRYGLACCPAHGDRQPSLSLRDAGGRLLARCHAGCTFLDILDALRGLGLVEGSSNFTPPTAEDWERIRQEDEAEAAKTEAAARRIWGQGQPIGRSPAETYLRARGIDCRLPETLRFHLSCRHPSSQYHPAMLAVVEGAERFSIHRTFLAADGSAKANVQPSKAMLGKTAGGAVRLVSGMGRLVVCEGIETGLSLASGLISEDVSIWAALSTSGMKRLDLPHVPGSLLIATDGDEAGRNAGNVLGERAEALGWSVSLLPAPTNQDWNDVLQERTRE